MHNLSLVQVHRSNLWDSLLDQPDLLVLNELRHDGSAVLVFFVRVTEIELIQVLMIQPSELC